MTAFTPEQEQTIQGVGLARFRKDNRRLMFVRFGEAAGARRLLAELAPRVSSLWEVRLFNEVFSEARRRDREGIVSATWVALGLTARAYGKLGVNLEELGAGTGVQAFKEGMAARSAQHIGDRAEDQSEAWIDEFKPGAEIDALLVIAADRREDLDEECDHLERRVGEAGARIVFAETGHTLSGALRGHEHFGFKDGISQPAVAEFDPPPAEHEPPAVPAGEFVLGYPDHTGAAAAPGDLWANGSFGVFRRLRQDVATFRAQAQAVAAQPPAQGEATAPPRSEPQIEAAMLGRWPSGAPLEGNPDQDPGDAGVTNAFDYSPDPQGLQTPRFAHVRNVDPRNEERPSSGEDPTANRRMIRVGIPYGEPLPPGAADDEADRGLHFLSVVADIERQFEFVQREWATNPNFPDASKPEQGVPYQPREPGVPADGCDPVIGAHAAGDKLSLHQPGAIHQLALMAETVRVTAGEYFFYPSIHAITRLGEGATGSA
jgi:Dyp-type peroxidase family